MPEVHHAAPQLTAPWGQSWGEEGGGGERRGEEGGEKKEDEERRRERRRRGGGGEEEEERRRRRRRRGEEEGRGGEGGGEREEEEERERDIIKLTHEQVRRGLIYASQRWHKFCTYKKSQTCITFMGVIRWYVCGVPI